MPSGKQTVHIYEELADREDRRDNPQMRDRFLILAADAALSSGLRDDAERLRARLLEHNPHHLLRPYPSLLEAIKSPDVASYIADLRHSYPPDEAFRLLEELRSSQEGLGTVAAASKPEPSAEPEPDHDEGETLADPGVFRFSDHTEPKLVPDEPPPASPPRPKVDLTPPRPTQGRTGIAAAEAELAEAIALSRGNAAASPPCGPGSVPLSRGNAAAALTARGSTAEPDEMPSALSYWMGNVLFGVLLTAGVGLLVWTFARPFLPL